MRQTEKQAAVDKMVSITISVDICLSKLWVIVKDREAWHAAVHGSQRVRFDLATEQYKAKYM